MKAYYRVNDKVRVIHNVIEYIDKDGTPKISGRSEYGKHISLNAWLVEIPPNQENIEVDWEKRRYELAKDILITTLGKELDSSGSIEALIKQDGTMYNFHSNIAINYADALIEKLKKK